MREVVLDAAGWTCPDDVYNSFFLAVGAPNWHGRNFNALRDGIAAGQINELEVPYRLVVVNYQAAQPGAIPMAEDFFSLIRELEGEGVPVALEIRVREPFANALR
jgi:RNAse (barnase) inhibitor barstar